MVDDDKRAKIRALAKTMSNAAIAERLGLSLSTVERAARGARPVPAGSAAAARARRERRPSQAQIAAARAFQAPIKR